MKDKLQLHPQDLPFKTSVSALSAEEALIIEHYLDILNLDFSSTASDVRKVAVSLRSSFQEKGLNQETVRALKWALEKTGDCPSTEQADPPFLRFLLRDPSFRLPQSVEDR